MAAGDTAAGELRSDVGAVIDTLRLGWSVAEVRGRHWPQGPRPQATPLPLRPDLVLPLRSQRVVSASREEAVASLVALVQRLGLDRNATFESGLRSAVAPWDTDTEHRHQHRPCHRGPRRLAADRHLLPAVGRLVPGRAGPARGVARQRLPARSRSCGVLLGPGPR